MSRFDNSDHHITECPSCGGDLSVQNNAFQLPVGTLLANRYYIGKVIGQGGFGITYVGCDTKLNMKIAVKEYYPQGIVGRISSYSNELTVTAGEQQVMYERQKQRFITEAQILAEFAGDPHVVRVSDILSENNTVYIIMEYIDGFTLEAYRHEKGKLSFKEVLTLLDPIMETLGEIHSKGLIHRDISPVNIMITNRRKEVKLLDFGSARDYEQDSDKSMSVILKPGYAPSEQYSRHGAQGPWSDVYALCATIYRLVTGVVPENSFERMAHDALKYPSELGTEITAEEEAVLMCGMAVQSGQRFTSMKDLRSAFQEAEKGNLVERAKAFYKEGETGRNGSPVTDKTAQESIETSDLKEYERSEYEETEILQEETGKTEALDRGSVRNAEEKQEKEQSDRTGQTESVYKPLWRNLDSQDHDVNRADSQDKGKIKRSWIFPIVLLIGILAVIGILVLVERSSFYSAPPAPAPVPEEEAETPEEEAETKASPEDAKEEQEKALAEPSSAPAAAQEKEAEVKASPEDAEEVKEEVQEETKNDVSIDDAQALYDEGSKYFSGVGAEQNYEEALKYFLPAADQGNAAAQNAIGLMYAHGLGVEQNYEEAVKYFRLAADQGIDAGLYHLGMMYENGHGVEQNYEEAVKYYRLAADQGNAWGQHSLGVMYAHGHGVEQSYEEAVKYFRLSADQENVDGLHDLGYMYYNGFGIEQSYEEAAKYFKLAADQRDLDAQLFLAEMYYKGEGVEKNYKEAVKYFKLAADQGHPYAQYALGCIYYNGEGAEQNYEEAAKYFKLAADQGDSDAQRELGFRYYYGEGAEQSYEKAMKYFKLAIDQGDTLAMSYLGMMYYKGYGAEQNYEEALKYLMPAADQGDSSAQNLLGIMYENGEGVEQNYEEAVRYYRLAADQEHQQAIEHLKELGEE